jgi:hypothetical protein
MGGTKLLIDEILHKMVCRGWRDTLLKIVNEIPVDRYEYMAERDEYMEIENKINDSFFESIHILD